MFVIIIMIMTNWATSTVDVATDRFTVSPPVVVDGGGCWRISKQNGQPLYKCVFVRPDEWEHHQSSEDVA